MSSFEDMLKASPAWFAVSMIAAGVAGGIAGTKWLEEKIEGHVSSALLTAKAAGDFQVKTGERGEPGVVGKPGEKGERGEKGDKGNRGEGTSLPSGIVIASWKRCDTLGDGWSDFHPGQGRMIVGAGDPVNDPYKQGLRSRSAWKPSMASPPDTTVGGSEFVELTERQIPGHSHYMFGTNFDARKAPIGRDYVAAKVEYGSGIGIDDGGEKIPSDLGYQLDRAIEEPHIGRTSVYGGASSSSETRAKPHPNMPPYIALYFCKKD